MSRPTANRRFQHPPDERFDSAMLADLYPMLADLNCMNTRSWFSLTVSQVKRAD